MLKTVRGTVMHYRTLDDGLAVQVFIKRFGGKAPDEIELTWDDGKCLSCAKWGHAVGLRGLGAVHFCATCGEKLCCEWWKRQRDKGRLSEDYFFCPKCGEKLEE